MQKSKILFVVVFILLLSLAVGLIQPVQFIDTLAAGPLSGKKIVVNPGHGWYLKSGTTWGFDRAEYWGIREDLVNAEIAMYLVEDLEAMGADVYPVREMDKNAGTYNNDKPWWQVGARYYLKDRISDVPSSVWDFGSNDWAKDLNSRPRYANWLKADLLISIHNNGCGTSIEKDSPSDDTNSCRGTETWYEKNMTKAAESKVLATLVQNRVIQAIQESIDPEWYSGRGVKLAENRYGELLQAEMPSALIEVAFHNRESPDNEMLGREDFKQTVAQAIADAIKDFFEANNTSSTDISAPDSYQCSQPGHVNFEGLPDMANLSTNTISGVKFTTTGGYTWIVSDTSTGKYNGKYPNGAYMTAGTNIGWLGPNQGSGRIDFPNGPASYFSLLVSNASPVYLDGYDKNGVVIATAGPAENNINTGHMTELKIARLLKDLAYVIVHDAGNYFIVDEVCTNASNTSNTLKRLTAQSYPMQTGQIASGNFNVDSLAGLTNQLHIYVGPFGSDVDIILIRPDGSQVQPDDPGVTIDKTPTYVEAFIGGAAPGQWGYQIVANQLEPGGEAIRITVDQEGFVPTQIPPMLINPGDKMVQYTDPISFSVNASDEDDPVTSLTFTAHGLPADLILTDNGDGTASIAGQISDAPKAYLVDITVTDPGGLSDTETVTIIVTQEDARATYTGPMLVSTGCATCSTAVVPLRATIQDISAVLGDAAYDAYSGEILNANVSFVARGAPDVRLCDANLTLLDPADLTTASAACDWTVDIGNSDGKDFTVGVVVDGYYTRNSTGEDTLVVVSKPTTYFLTGGGYLLNQSSGGRYAGDPGEKSNFGLNVKFNKKLTSLQGRVTLLVRQAGRVYQIKSNVLSSLVVKPYDPALPASGTAELLGKASITDVTDPLLPLDVAGNARIQVVMKDNGEPGSADLLSVTVWSSTGELLYASNWNRIKTVPQALDGGNLQVH